jgi:O-antigen/teichoic acid export membrane protein
MTRRQQSLTRSVSVTAIGTAFPPLAALVTAPLLAQGLGVEARGEVAAAQAVALLTVSVTAFGLPEAITFFVARGGHRRSRTSAWIVGFVVLAGVVSSLVVALLAGWLSGGSQSTEDLIRFASLSIVPALLLGLVRGSAAGHELWGRIATERIVGSGARMIGTVFLLASDNLNVHSATALMVFTPLLGVMPYLFPSPATHRVPQDRPATVREVASYSARTWIGAVSGILLMRIDQALLVPFAGATQLGLYAVAVSIGEVPLVVNSAIRDVAFARHSGNFSAERLAQAARLSGFAAGSIALVLAALSPWGIPTLFGEEFSEAVPVTLLLLVAVVAGTPGSIAGAGLSALGRPELRSASLIAAALINIIVLLVVSARWGAMGAALATLLGNLVSSNLNIYWFNAGRETTWGSFYAVRLGDLRTMARSMLRFITGGSS